MALADVDSRRLDERVAALGPDRALSVVADVADTAACEMMVARTVERFGRLDILVNNAGIGVFGRVGRLDPADWRRVLGVDLDGVFNTSRAAIAGLAKTGGVVINVSPTSGLGGDPGQSAYNAAKAAVLNFTRTMALEYGREGVRVNSVSPGLILTEPNVELQKNEMLRSEYAERVALGWGGGRTRWRPSSASSLPKRRATSPAPISWLMAG